MKLFYISILSIATISIASAGQIEIGAGQNGSGISTLGLTSAYIGSTTWSEKNYVSNLFINDTITNSTLGTSTLPTTAAGFQQFTDSNNNVTFGMLNDSSNGNNYWASASPATQAPSSITVPIGVSGVSTADILLSDYYGLSGSSGLNNDTVLFSFSGGGSLSFNLSNGVEIDSVHDCLTGTCPAMSGTTTSANTDKAWAGSYSEIATATPYSSTTGNLSLLDLSFSLGDFSGQTLTNIQITDNKALAQNSRLALSAITVSGSNAQLVTTPEPSTVLLFLAGLGVMGLLAQRRKARL